MSRLFTADVHAVLDRIEEPDVLLKHAIREMEEELARSEQRVKQLEHERSSLADRHRKVQAVLAELGEQLDICFHERQRRSSRARSSNASSRPSGSTSTSRNGARRSTSCSSSAARRRTSNASTST